MPKYASPATRAKRAEYIMKHYRKVCPSTYDDTVDAFISELICDFYHYADKCNFELEGSLHEARLMHGADVEVLGTLRKHRRFFPHSTTR